VQYFHDAMAVFFHTGFKGFHDAHDAGSELGPAVHAFARVCGALRSFGILESANSAFAFVLFGVVRDVWLAGVVRGPRTGDDGWTCTD
jgi:hypothetical protein